MGVICDLSSSGNGELLGEAALEVDLFRICLPLAGDSTVFSSDVLAPFTLLVLLSEDGDRADPGEPFRRSMKSGVPFAAWNLFCAC